jgi:hypothetical protein
VAVALSIAPPAGAGAAQFEATGALPSQLVSARQVEPGKQRLLYRYGPLVAAPGQNLVLLGPVTIEKPLGDGYVTRYRPNLVGPDGTPPQVEDLHMHHALFVNMSQPDMAAPHLPQRIGGFAEEKTIATLPEPYGYPVKATDVWALNYMLHNGTPETRSAFIELEVDWVPAGTPAAAALKPAYPLWLDVRNGEGYPVFDTERGSGAGGTITYPDDFADPYRGGPRLNEWTADRDMTLVATAGHLHPGGLWTDLDVVRGGRPARAFRSEARYFDPNGPVSWDMAMEYTPDSWRVAVRRGDVLRISTEYETQRASWYESMGIMLTFWADGASGADPFTEPVETSGEPTHGHLPEAGNYGGEPTGLADPATLPDGATLADGVGIADFVYAPGDMNVSVGELRLPPVIDPGARSSSATSTRPRRSRTRSRPAARRATAPPASATRSRTARSSSTRGSSATAPRATPPWRSARTGSPRPTSTPAPTRTSAGSIPTCGGRSACAALPARSRRPAAAGARPRRPRGSRPSAQRPTAPAACA